ncbi:O-acetyltransferase OatA [Anatilimnocola aggregata]|uniref:O-acetyltransferase OatA n=1 Tax=Anatilimnocola aggregata TaxID=2528021 RepID=A0A517YDE3_9BACT|nr:acyltransferase [Anatilimnocola aggregata]QDU28152.1 O-acetyltransferase OatA [Anatilimnocola aggregata]
MSTIVAPPEVVSPISTTSSSPVPAQQQPTKFYRPELDGLRFCCFLAVFIGHSFLISPQMFSGSGPMMAELGRWLVAIMNMGYVAVGAFFVLSSYLITELLLREHERTGRIDIGAFYARRALRIWPLYYFFLIVTLVVERSCGLASIPTADLPWYFTFLGNWQIVTSAHIPHSAAQLLWTVAIEEQFYLVWPVLIAFISPKRLVWACLALLLAGSVTRIWLWQTGASHFAIYFNTAVHFDTIAWGALLAIGTRCGWLDSWSAAARWSLVTGGVVAAILTQRYLADVQPFPAWPVIAYPLFALAALAVVAGAIRLNAEQTSPLTHPWLVHLGKISYGLYIWHLLAILLVYRLGWCAPRSPGTILFALPLTILLAELSYIWVEKPFLAWKERYARADAKPEGLPRQSAVAEI